MSVTDDAVEKLQKISSLPPNRARQALERADGDIDKALLEQIDAGLVDHNDLDPDLAPLELFGRISIKAYLRVHEDMLRRMQGRPGLEEFQRNVDNARAALDDPEKLAHWGRGLHQQAMQRKHPELAKEKEKQAKKLNKSTLKQPPFPPLKWDSDGWKGSDALSSWAGFFAAGGGKSKGKIQLHLNAVDGADKGAPPAAEQVAAYKHLKANDSNIIDAAMDAILKQYPEWRKNYNADEMESDEGEPFHMPPIKKRQELKDLVSPDDIRILNVAKDKCAYLGITLNCTWDDEHGIGVLMHKSHVVEVGHADVAFNDKLARRDGGKPITT